MSLLPSNRPPASTVLVLARPGEEAPLHDWLVAHRPWVVILTDGSAPGGQDGESTLETSRLALAQRGARESSLFGRSSESEIQRRLDDEGPTFWVELARDIAELFVVTQCTHVVVRAQTGIDAIRDLPRLLVDAALARIAHGAGQVPLLEEFHNGDPALSRVAFGASLLTRFEPPCAKLAPIAHALIAWSDGNDSPPTSLGD